MKPQFEYQRSKQYFAQVPAGLEEIAAGELADLGAGGVRPDRRGIYFTAGRSALYRINYRARLVTRVLAPLLSFRCRDRDDLYRAGASIPWDEIFSSRQTFGMFANVSGNAQLRNSHFAALCVKDAVVDVFRSRHGERPNVDRQQPDLWLNLHVRKDRGTISMDTSGGSLHRRGYRQRQVAAPIQETLAAAMVTFSGWDGRQPLVDPMCGGGTLLCEALMAHCRIPAGYFRPRFGFQRLPDFDAGRWRRIRSDAEKAIRPLARGLISGSDIDRQAIAAAAANCRALPGGDGVVLTRQDVENLSGLENRVILCNPPYGVRLGEGTDLPALYRRLGDTLKHHAKGSRAFLFFGQREMLKHIGLKPAWKKPIRNAGLDGRLARFDLY